ncbi:dihydrolipoyllysine-residue acetyltransferase [Sulfuritalea sp.]|uniref:dihydrolipoyllysine-residue acetyltransferase n=1 Tax=Sulfuritalea sp. TaxID=2480090 RepID=UPI001AC1CCA5|nr:dihydrolipoyllysine-residue acetyltransferase [Sulfuritalea sp.]MBN8475615.1 dihydrolipoyllysine-residue acetyltransferase [Sulfuritalea sp.]
MANIVEVKVPDIGDFKDVPVIELLVKVGDTVKAEDSLITLESDKATMDVPSPVSGVVTELKLKVGDKVAEGSLVALIDSAAAGQAAAPAAAPAAAAPVAPAPASPAAPASSAASVVEVRVPDIGDFKDVPIIGLLVKVGDTVKAEDSLMTLESDKATMDIPSPVSGVVSELKVKVGDKVAEGVLLALVKVSAGATAVAAPVAAAPAVAAAVTAAAAVAAPAAAPAASSGAGADYRPGDNELISSPPRVTMLTPADRLTGKAAHASPSVRRFARELGVDVSKVAGSGPKGRILQSDIQAYVKGMLSAPPPAAPAAAASGGGLDLLPWPKIDFSKFGPIDVQPLSRIKKISGANLSRNWVMIPAVTYHEDADITDLEAFRVQINKENEKAGPDGKTSKLTMLAFLIKAVVRAMQKYPEFNSSIDGDNLVMKKYFNIGFAADTPNGLMVPVIKNAESKGVFELAKESGDLAKQAREGKLKPADMQGACFTISSLGGIGGTYFAPIVNAPEVAILGVNKSAMKPVWDGKQFVPRLTLPLSLTADHRVIDGALATRFNVYLAQLLADMRRSML